MSYKIDDVFQNCNEKFFLYFESKFDREMRTPELLKCGFEEALRKTLANGPLKMKPFFIYLHDNNSENHEIFFTENICNEIICDYLLVENWPIWPIDITNAEDKSSFFSLIQKRLESTISNYNAQLPMMLMFVREGMTIMEGAHMCSKDPMTIVGQLYDQGGSFIIERDMRIQLIESKREQREFEKMQKQIALQKEMEEQDRKEKAKLAEIARKEEEETKLMMESNRQNQIEYAKSQIKDIKSSPSNFSFRFRLPNGETATRDFSDSQTTNEILYFIESFGYLRSEIKVLYSYPLKNMCEIGDLNMVLRDSGMSKRDLLNVQAIK